MTVGRLFHKAGPSWAKARSPQVLQILEQCDDQGVGWALDHTRVYLWTELILYWGAEPLTTGKREVNFENSADLLFVINEVKFQNSSGVWTLAMMIIMHSHIDWYPCQFQCCNSAQVRRGNRSRNRVAILDFSMTINKRIFHLNKWLDLTRVFTRDSSSNDDSSPRFSALPVEFDERMTVAWFPV